MFLWDMAYCHRELVNTFFLSFNFSPAALYNLSFCVCLFSDQEDTEFGDCTTLIEDDVITASQQVQIFSKS